MAPSVSNIKRVGGSVALDFANSIDWRLSEAPHDWLAGYDDLLAWARATDCIKPAERTALVKLARQNAGRAAEAFAFAIELREAIDRLGRAVAQGSKPLAADIASLNAALKTCPPREQLIHARGQFAWVVPEPDLATPLRAVAWAAADLLAGPDRERIKVCAGEDCGWLFLDRSRNIARRWCSMADCGNRDKARRFYARHKVA